MSILRMFYSKTPKIKNADGKVPPNSIASLEKVKIKGIDQCLLIRGHDVNNPLLLFLHGGPGSPEMGLAYLSQRRAEEYFTIVHWDQRGAGKSFSKKIPAETLNVEQFISDTHELVQLLKSRFNKEKIYLLGHSWGSVLGTLVVQRYPDLFHAYIGMGQVVNMIENENISYKYTLDAAKKAGNNKVVNKLETLDPPYIDDIKALRFQRKWLARYGGALHDEKSMMVMIKKGFLSPEYSLRDLPRFIKGSLRTAKAMWEELADINFIEQVPELKVPVYFFEGRYDYQVPFELAEKFYEKLKAPKKKLIWFEKSGHCPNFEEPEKFQDALISVNQEIKGK